MVDNRVAIAIWGHGGSGSLRVRRDQQKPSELQQLEGKELTLLVDLLSEPW